MHFLRLSRIVPAALIFILTLGLSLASFSQSKPQKNERPTGEGKKNARPTEEDKKKAEEERKRQEEEKNAVFDPTVEKIETNVVDVDAVVINKKTGQIISGLKKENFAIFENGVKQNISSFATPESPITVTLVVEYSRWSELFGRAGNGGYFEPGVYETVRPVAEFLSRFIKPPNDFASVIAFDMRPTPITDFTNDPARIQQTIEVLLRSTPAFTDSNLFDALKFALVGGRGDSVVLDNSKSEYANYGGMVDVRSKRRAIILVASGIDTFSKSNFDEARKVILSVRGAAPNTFAAIAAQWRAMHVAKLRRRSRDQYERSLRRMGEAVDQANVICFLASSHADFVTGLTIDVTGGL